MKEIAIMDKDILDGLRNVGFGLDFGEDGSGFLLKYYTRGGGYCASNLKSNRNCSFKLTVIGRH